MDHEVLHQLIDLHLPGNLEKTPMEGVILLHQPLFGPVFQIQLLEDNVLLQRRKVLLRSLLAHRIHQGCLQRVAHVPRLFHQTVVDQGDGCFLLRDDLHQPDF